MRARALPQCKTCTWVSSGPMGCCCCWRWPTFSGQSAVCGRLCANLSRDAHHHHHHRHLIGTRRRTGPSWPALEWRPGLGRGERPEPDSANLSLLSGAGSRPAHPTLHHGRGASLASEPGHGGGTRHLPQQPPRPPPRPPPRLPPLLPASSVVDWVLQ